MTINKPSPVIPFASGHFRAQILTTLLAVFIVLQLIAMASNYSQIMLLKRMKGGATVQQAEVVSNDNRQKIIGGAEILSYLITGIVFLIWIHRAHRNLPALGAYGLKYSPGWAVGYFFIPFLNLVRPYQVVKEIWKASGPDVDRSNPQAWKDNASSPLIGWWWGLGIASGAVSSGGGSDITTVDSLIAVTWIYLASEILVSISAILAILLIREIDSRQEEKHRRLALFGAQGGLAPSQPLP